MPSFLSDEWFEQVRAVRTEYADLPVPPSAQGVQVNLLVQDGPDGDREVHLAAGDGGLALGEGFLADASTTVTLGYDVAKEMFANGNMQPAMQAFMRGEIKVDGDVTRVMALQQAGAPTAEQQEMQEKIKAITD
jgi:hypothetical protein